MRARHPVLKIAVATLIAFIVAFGGILLYARPVWDDPTCEGDECALALAASVSLAIVGGVAVALGVGLVTWLILRRGGSPLRL